MTFVPEESKTPTTIGNIVVILKDAVASEDEPAYQSAHFQVDVLDQGGNRMRDLAGDLEPHLTTAQKTALTAFMDNLRAKAESEILPPAE